MVNLSSLTEHRLTRDEVRGLQTRHFSPGDVADVLQGFSSTEMISLPVRDPEAYITRLRENGVDIRSNGNGDFGYSRRKAKRGGVTTLVVYRR
mgnify:CR=1 FL=1